MRAITYGTSSRSMRQWLTAAAILHDDCPDGILKEQVEQRRGLQDSQGSSVSIIVTAHDQQRSWEGSP